MSSTSNAGHLGELAASKIERSSSSKVDHGFRQVCMVVSSKGSVAVAQIIHFDEAALSRPVQARMAERQLGRLRTGGSSARRTWNAPTAGLARPPQPAGF